jgi:acyl carrier protein
MAGEAEQAWLQRSGVAALAPEDALAAMDRLIGARAQAVVARVNWRIFRELFELRGARPLLADLATEPAAGGAAMPERPSAAVAALAAIPEAGRRDALIALLQEEVAAVLGLRDGRRPDPRKGFFELGLDSLLAVELRNRLARSFARKLPTTLVFDHAHILALADHLDGAPSPLRPPAVPAAPAAADEADMDAALARRLRKLEGLVRQG